MLDKNGINDSDLFGNILNSLKVKVYWVAQSKDNKLMYNFLVLNNEEVLINSAYSNSFSNILKECKLTSVSVDLTNLEKAGGGVRCATLPTYRI